MLNVYIADLTGLEESYEEKVNMLHRERADKLNIYKMHSDRVRGLGAGLLLEKGLEDYLQQVKILPENSKRQCVEDYEKEKRLPKDYEGRAVIRYAYGYHGKPYLKDYPYIYFSLSHSGDMAVLALSDSEVGIDIQEHRGYKEKIAKRFYHKEEQKMLENVSDAEHKEILFYKIWTSKEAYIKYTGKGMQQDLRDFYWNSTDKVIVSEEKRVVCIDLFGEEPNYQCSIVSGNNCKKIDKITKIVL